MLELRNVRKSYTTGDFTQVALNNVGISFRDNEFVAVLGPSGSGKTTLLNIVGGLDQHDSGQLVIDGTDTSAYRDRDWDAYRNNRIGFVFQSYNLIPHQTILSNVELALTLSGVSPTERKQRATQALESVDLGDHVHKRPNQLSGGQMQRVAIARALINDPEILLADEPTGALDSHTSAQIMAMMTEIANDRLVIMVTHNPELAQEYATRIVNLKDGRVENDSNPYLPLPQDIPKAKSVRKTSMTFLTAISLSFNNLMTKKGRTLMTAFAGSIGIIGIAAILSLANGVNEYIKSIEEDTLSVYPLTIQSQGFDMTSMMAATADMTGPLGGEPEEPAGHNGAQDGPIHEIQMMTRMFASIGSNDLAALKAFFEDNGGNINEYVSSINYSYNVTPQIFSSDTGDGARQINPDTSFAALGMDGDNPAANLMPVPMTTNAFAELIADTSLVEEQYDVVAGKWPQRYDEVMVVLTGDGGISDFTLYAMGLRDPAELDTMMSQLLNQEQIVTPTGTKSFTYDQVMDRTFKLVEASDYYQYDPEYDLWTDQRNNQDFLKELVQGGEDLQVVGIMQPKEGSSATSLNTGIYYTAALTEHLIDRSGESTIVESQLAQPNVNVFSGRTFDDEEENPDRNDFDMSSLVTLDEEALTAAFTFDESKLSVDVSSLDLTMPGLQIDPAALPQLELEDMLGDLNLEEIASDIDLEAILASVDVSNLGEVDLGVDLGQVDELTSNLVAGYFEFCVEEGLDPTDTETNFPLYLESDSAAEILDQATAMFDQAQAGLEGFQEQLADQLITGIGEAVQEQIQASAAELEAQIQATMANYMSQVMKSLSDQISSQIGNAVQTQISSAMQSAMGQLAANMSDAMGIDEAAFKDAFKFNMDEEELSELMMSMITEPSSLESNLARLGYANPANPSAIDIYPVDFESKSQVIKILEDYNAEMAAEGNEDRVVTFTDLVGTLMSSVTDIVNVVSYVLVAFVAISLVVSSIMIGVITYISVLERRKEIGILRSIGASKRDIRRVFNAETLIVGFVAGAMGIMITALLIIPVNEIVSSRFNIDQVAQLPPAAAVALVLISMGLTFLAGLIPSSAASRKDPVEALRSE